MSSTVRFLWSASDIIPDIERASEAALKLAALHLQGKSQQEAPLDTGDLLANCTISDVEKVGNESTITTGYSLPYALKQHEHTEYRHPRGGKAKYLEDPYKANEEKCKTMIRNKLLETFK